MKDPAKHARRPGLFVEALEPRIAPASLSGITYTAVTLEEPQLITAGFGLATSQGDAAQNSGSLLLAVEQGMVKVFTTDLNGNGRFDPNEITGLSVGDGARFTLFVDVNGDVVTNLQADGQLTDSGLPDPRRAIDPLYRDGRVLLNSNIESITLRSVTQFDLKPGETVEGRVALSSYSIHGNIYAGSVGVKGQGIVIDATGLDLQTRVFRPNTVDYQQGEILPNIGGIRAGTAVNGHSFNFGYATTTADGFTPGDITVGGAFVPFTPGIGQLGGDIVGLRSGSLGANGALVGLSPFTIDAIIAGDGGIGARGGNIENITLFGDSGGLRLVAGQGGLGAVGGNGGSILNLSDLGSTNGMVEIRTGSGGIGLTGNGGAAGTLTLGQFDMNGQLFIGLGSGGDAFAQAGTGTGLIQANIRPTDANGPYSPIKVLSTHRVPGQLGSVTPIDFNGDGFTDLVYLTDTPDQLMIRFGTLAGITNNSPTLYFATPGLSAITGDGARTTGVTVGDFNRDGFLDLAIAPSVTNSFGPIRVFLNPGGVDGGGFGSGNGWSQAALLPRGGNYIDSYVASPLPFFNLTGTAFQRSGMPVTNLVSGEFNADPNQFVDLALTPQVFTFVTLDDEEDPFREFTALMVMSGTGDGRFFADFRYNEATTLPGQFPVALDRSGFRPEVSVFDRHNAVQLLATAENVIIPGVPELLVAAALNDGDQKNVRVFQWGTNSLNLLAQAVPRYDEIKVKDGLFDGYDTKDGTPAAITVVDVDTNGEFEIAVLNAETSVSLLRALVPPTPLPPPPLPTPLSSFAFNGGIVLKGEQVSVPNFSPPQQPVFSGDENVNFLRILGGQFTPGALGNPLGEVALFSFANGGGDYSRAFSLMTLVPYPEVPGAADNRLGVRLATPDRILAPGSGLLDKDVDLSVIIQDIYKGRTGPGLNGFVAAIPTSNLRDMGIESVAATPLVRFDPIAPNVINLLAGNGGNSLLGTGGRGGGLGSGFASLSGSAFSVILPKNESLQPDVVFSAGRGGFGFERGGDGGAIRGLFVDYVEEARTLASNGFYFGGAGGAGLFGPGGAGGDIWGNIIETGRTFGAGAGGSGTEGGMGGRVIGGGGLFGYDNYSGVVTVLGGQGGFGVGKAGNGGAIMQFANLFPPLTAGQGGYLEYTGGAGGGSLAGAGGAGGSILGSSPLAEVNKLVGTIQLAGGQGGLGLTGGAGGGIVNFRNPAGLTDPLPIFSAIAGHGGDGIIGAGGAGGSIENFTVSANGVVVGLQVAPGVFITGRFNRILAGNGGSSFGGDGGAGGRLDLVNSAANNSAIVAAAGRGGDGLRAGGVGGSVLRTNLDSPVKVLVMAGDGGNAYGALASAPNVKLSNNENDLVTQLRAFGGFNGIGGNGGSINNFRQFSASDNVATDLIAGQGGSLVNYGSIASGVATSVGAGGSVTAVNLASQAGRGRADVAITGYDPVPLGGGVQVAFADFIRTTAGWTFRITDAENVAAGEIGGNVGVIVGAAGTVRGGSLAGDGLNKAGVVTGFQAKSIMSMVAGSVDNVAAIRAISDIRLTSPQGDYGAYKNDGVPGRPNTLLYFSAAGVKVGFLEAGGALIDGAVAAQKFTPATLVGEKRVFSI